jgi:hypothetical protein
MLRPALRRLPPVDGTAQFRPRVRPAGAASLTSRVTRKVREMTRRRRSPPPQESLPRRFASGRMSSCHLVPGRDDSPCAGGGPQLAAPGRPFALSHIVTNQPSAPPLRYDTSPELFQILRQTFPRPGMNSTFPAAGVIPPAPPAAPQTCGQRGEELGRGTVYGASARQ